MNPVTQRIYAAAAIILSLIPAAYAGPDTIFTTTKLSYPNGKPATDATVIADLIDYVSHTITTQSYKPDQSGLASFTYDENATDFGPGTLIFYIISPTGIGFLPQGDPDAYPTSTLAPFTSMRVHVVDSAGSPVPSVRVAPSQFLIADNTLAWNAAIPGPWSGTTDKDGWVTLKELPQGLEVQFTIVDSHVTAPNGEFDVQLQETSTTPDVTVQVVPAASVSGTVLYSDTQKPAAGIQVTATSAKNRDNCTAATTDKNGNYTISGLTDGPFHIETHQGTGNFKDWISHSQNIITDVGAHISGINLTLIHGGLVTGKVTDKAGKALQYANVSALAQGSEYVSYGSTQTGPDGTYTLRILPCKADVYPRYWNSPVDTPPQSIDIAEGQTIGLNFQVAASPPTSAVHGIVLGPDSKPVSGALITALGQGRVQYTISDSQGRFTVDSPDLKPKAIFLARSTAPSGDLATAAPVTYNGEPQITLNLTAGNLCVIKGQVNDSDGNPVPNARVQLSRRGARFQYDIQDATCNAQGQYTFAPTFGNIQYSVHAGAVGFGWANNRPFDAPGGQTVQVPPIAVRTEDAIAGGTVVDAKGYPVANVIVEDPTSNSYNARSTSDKSGHFLLTKVPRGKINAFATAPDGTSGEGSLTTGRGDNVLYLDAAPK